LLRWYMRFFIWFRFLWHVSRMNLNLIPSHPDRWRWYRLPGQDFIRLRPNPFRSGCNARWSGCQPSPLPGRKPAFL
jgi:hypothetical protein